MRMIIRIGALLVCAACAQENLVSDNIHVETIYRINGAVYSEVSYKGELPNGPSRLYHPNGKLYLDIMYKDGVKHGTSKQYYQSGVLYMEAEYVNGSMEGVARKYHKDGKLKAEIPYAGDYPCLGLKEYILNGDPRPHYPDLVVTPESRLVSDYEYLLHLSLTEPVQSATFFIGELKNGCLHDALQDVASSGNETGTITINVMPGESIKSTINIVARIETLVGNVLVVQQRHHVEINFSH